MLSLGYDTAWPLFTPQPVNRLHPLNQGRAAWWTTLPELSGGSTFHDLMGLYPGTLGGMTTAGTGWQPTSRPGGFGHLNFSGTSNHVSTAYAGLSGASAFTIAVWFRRLATGTLALFCGAGDNNSTNRVVFQVWSDGILYLSYGIGIYAYFTSNDTNWHRYLAAFDGTQTGNTNRLRAYLDGVSQTLTYSGTVPATMPTFTGTIDINKDPGSNYGTSVGDDFTLWNRSLSAAEALADYDLSRRGYPGVLNRWRPTRFGGTTVGGGSATLSAATGVFGFSGNAANLLAGRVLGAATGAYGLTGQAAALLSGRVLPAATGAFAFTGIDAGLLVGRVLTASTGVYTVTGNNAGLLAGRVIVASTGVYILAGNAANLVFSGQPGAFTLVAETGTFVLTGNAAGLLAGRVLTAAPGSFALSSVGASLTWSGHITPSFIDPDEVTMITP